MQTRRPPPDRKPVGKGRSVKGSSSCSAAQRVPCRTASNAARNRSVKAGSPSALKNPACPAAVAAAHAARENRTSRTRENGPNPITGDQPRKM